MRVSEQQANKTRVIIIRLNKIIIVVNVNHTSTYWLNNGRPRNGLLLYYKFTPESNVIFLFFFFSVDKTEMYFHAANYIGHRWIKLFKIGESITFSVNVFDQFDKRGMYV